MDVGQFNEIVMEQIEFCRNTLIKKAGEYATEDRLHNFKVSAHVQGNLATQALAGMMVKHTTSIYDMIASGKPYPLEVWEEKITDHLNYLLLLKAAVYEIGLFTSPGDIKVSPFPQTPHAMPVSENIAKSYH